MVAMVGMFRAFAGEVADTLGRGARNIPTIPTIPTQFSRTDAPDCTPGGIQCGTHRGHGAASEKPRGFPWARKPRPRATDQVPNLRTSP
jgi:hypothetical protein